MIIDARRFAISSAILVLVVFFLPWIQLSCMGVRDSASGYDLARGGSSLLWLAPLFMTTVLVFGFARFIWARIPLLFAAACSVGGSLTAYLMYREYSDTTRSTILGMYWTAWFWLGIVGSIGLAASGLAFYGKRTRSP